ncbi:MAG: hypothetical protein JWP91_1563 [Fibrobacteres bacterium]|nr:hypothetical protein [Fibrobacterota bacterium]
MPAVLLTAALAPALENPMQSFLGLDYRRQIWMQALPGVPDGEGNGFPRVGEPGSDSAPKFSGALSLDYSDLIRRSGRFFYDHGQSASGMRFAATAFPDMEIRFSAERSDADLDFGDASAWVDQSGVTWGWTGSAAYRPSPKLTATVTLGGDSRTSHENALRALSMGGTVGSGFAWSATLGERNRDFPLTLYLKDYRPLAIPLRLRQRFESLAFSYGKGPWTASWSGDWTRLGYANVPPQGYVLGDSGATWLQAANLAFDRRRGGEGPKATMDFRLGSGSHAFRGTTRKDLTQTRFSYQEGEHRSYSLRADLLSSHRAWEWGLYAGASELEYDALRPDAPFGRHFWDRNGVIDSYQGSLLGVFNSETWLLNGAAYAAQAGGGGWAEKVFFGCRAQAGLGYQRLVLESNSHLTKRETSLLVAVEEETFDTTYPKVTADVLTPEARVSRSWGPVYISAEAAQALPVRVEIRREGKAAGTSAGKGGDAYSGGTEGRVEIGWRLP